MGIAVAVVLFIVALALVYASVLYNGLVRLKHAVAHAWRDIDVLFRQRHEELSKLLDACRQLLPAAQELLTAVDEARSHVRSAQDAIDLRALGGAENALRVALGRLLALAEDCAGLKNDPSFTQLRMRISALESSIADRCEVYNEAVSQNNLHIEQFPAVLIAQRFRFGTAERLEFTLAETADANLASLFRY